MEEIMTKKEEQYLIRKWQILDIAVNHFIRYGFYGTSTRKIAEEAGISSGLMFHYFPNKLALYEALVEIGCDKLTIDSGNGESPLIFFERQVEWFLSVATQNNFAAKMFVFMGLVAINSKDVSERATQMMQEHDVEALSVPYIIKGQEMGIIREGDPLTLSVLFYSSIQGFAEVLVSRHNLTIPKKEWFLAILKNDNLEEK